MAAFSSSSESKDNEKVLGINEYDEYGYTYLHRFARDGIPKEKFEEFLEFNPDLNQKTLISGETALMLSIIAGYLDIVKLLIEKGADLNNGFI